MPQAKVFRNLAQAMGIVSWQHRVSSCYSNCPQSRYTNGGTANHHYRSCSLLVPFDAHFVSALTYLAPRRIAELLSSDRRPGSVRIFEVENQLSPADLYCYLHARFGPPNGLQNFLRTQDSDNLVHWNWTLGHDHGLLDIQGTNFRTLFIALGLREPHSHPVDDLVAAIKSDFANHGPAMSECRQALESWVEFVSPYQRLRRSIEQLMEELQHLNPDDVCEPSAPIDLADTAMRESFIEQWTVAAQTLNKAFGICFGIRSMLPVMAEAFINLLLFCLMNKQMRADDRLRENAFRQHIDVRIRSLHLNCIGFEKPVDYSNPACARFHTLINERNDLLHGNVSIDKLRFNDLYFSGTVPVFKTYRSMWHRAFDVQRRSVGLPHIQHEFDVVLAFIDYVLSCLTDPMRKNVEQVLSKLELGYNVKEDRVGVLFPDHLIDFRLPPA